MQPNVMEVLEKYLPGPFKQSGTSNILTKCPFHKGGNESKPSFSVNIEKGLFHCFTGDCGVQGNIYQLLKLLQVPKSLIASELKLLKPLLNDSYAKHEFNKKTAFVNKDPLMAKQVLPESILGVYKFCPTSLVEDGFLPEVLSEYEVGFDQRANRVTYPIRDLYGNLAGFSCGATNSTTHPHPKYKVYQGKRVGLDGKYLESDFGQWFDQKIGTYSFENHSHLWNFHRVWKKISSGLPVESLCIVEGFKAALWLIQNGYPDTVALMGSYISPLQKLQLARVSSKLILCLDNDLSGKKGTVMVGTQLWEQSHGKVYCINYPNEDTNTQPDSYDKESINWMITNARLFTKHVETTRRENAF